MSSGLSLKHDGWRFATLLDDDGKPPCDPPDDCRVCALFTHRRPGETRAGWLSRITGYTQTALEEAS